MESLQRNCPNCNIILVHKRKQDWERAVKSNRLCKSCSQLAENRRDKTYCELTSYQKSIILGMLLGDSYFSYGKYSVVSGMHNEHSGKQRDYALWKAEMLKEIYTSHKERTRFDARTEKTYTTITVVYKSHPFIHKLYEDMRPMGMKKGVNSEILSQLTPVSIAIWYCDDGSLYCNGDISHLTLSTNGFIFCIDEIVSFFKDTFDIGFKKQKSGAIRITSQTEIEKFMKIVQPHIPHCMSYKIWKRKLL